MHAASPVYLATKITILLLLSWLSETASGGCTRYGHACWGGHGKRSGGLTGRDVGVGPSNSVGPSNGALDGSAVWTPADYVLARVASGGPLAALLDVSASETAPRNANLRQPWEHWGDLTSDEGLGRARTGHRVHNAGSQPVPDMMPASGGVASNDAGQDDDEAPAPRDLLVMAAGDPVDQEQLHLYKILNRSTRKVN